jgi:hypothetical protein
MNQRALIAIVATGCTLGLVTGMGVIGLVSPAGAGYGATARFETTLTGAKEKPGPGDADGRGVAAVKLSKSKSRVCVTIKKVTNLALPATMAHIHQASATSAGPIRVTLAPPKAKKVGRPGKSKSCAVVSAALLNHLLTYPQDFYVNVHTTQFPDGAIRGQLA